MVKYKDTEVTVTLKQTFSFLQICNKVHIIHPPRRSEARSRKPPKPETQDSTRPRRTHTKLSGFPRLSFATSISIQPLVFSPGNRAIPDCVNCYDTYDRSHVLQVQKGKMRTNPVSKYCLFPLGRFQESFLEHTELCIA